MSQYQVNLYMLFLLNAETHIYKKIRQSINPVLQILLSNHMFQINWEIKNE